MGLRGALYSGVGISPAWEEESPGRNPKSLKKVSNKASDPRAQKSEKSLGESPKSLEKVSKNGFFEIFRTLPETFFRLLVGARRSEDFFETFFRLLGFRPGDSSSQAGGVLYSGGCDPIAQRGSAREAVLQWQRFAAALR